MTDAALGLLIASAFGLALVGLVTVVGDALDVDPWNEEEPILGGGGA